MSAKVALTSPQSYFLLDNCTLPRTSRPRNWREEEASKVRTKFEIFYSNLFLKFHGQRRLLHFVNNDRSIHYYILIYQINNRLENIISFCFKITYFSYFRLDSLVFGKITLNFILDWRDLFLDFLNIYFILYIQQNIDLQPVIINSFKHEANIMDKV